MKIKVGDRIEVWHKPLNREGVIDDITIALQSSDKAGKFGVSVKEYDIDLNYYGSIDYTTDNGDSYWSYFHQIKERL